MLAKLVHLLPPDLIRLLGLLQFRVPFLRGLARRIGSSLAARTGTIKHGVGSGLKFNATGGYPGYLLGTTEREEQRALADHLTAGDVFYDLGANIGFYATIAGRIVGPRGQVYAFEPFPASAERIRNNAALNGFDHIRVFELAVYDRAGTVPFNLGHECQENRIGRQEPRDATGAAAPVLQVRTVALDDLIESERLRPPSVIMLDVEGAEVEALRGMAETIRRSRPVILCEVHWIVNELRAFYEGTLAPLGYTMSTLNGSPPPTTPKRYHAIMKPSGNGMEPPQGR
jgi:FkbM family methyltransferase